MLKSTATAHAAEKLQTGLTVYKKMKCTVQLHIVYRILVNLRLSAPGCPGRLSSKGYARSPQKSTTNLHTIDQIYHAKAQLWSNEKLPQSSCIPVEPPHPPLRQCPKGNRMTLPYTAHMFGSLLSFPWNQNHQTLPVCNTCHLMSLSICLRPSSKNLGTLPSPVMISQVPKCGVIFKQIHQKLPLLLNH